MSSERVPRPHWRRHTRVGGLARALTGIAVLVLAGCGSTGGQHATRGQRAKRQVARATAYVAEAPDPLAAESFPQPAGAPRHAKAGAPATAGREAFISPGAPSNQQVLAELRQEKQLEQAEAKASPGATVDAQSGKATPSPDLPLRIQEVIAGGNAIADFPYVYGGGHRSFIDDAYDCSGSVSYALAAGGLIGAPETSGQLKTWGAPGPGRYLTVFATVGHTFMWVDGLWFDTAGRAGPYSTRWLTARPSLVGYVERHYPGL